MRDVGQVLIEALRSGYATPVVLAIFTLLTRRVWIELAQTLREWVRSAPARRRADLEKKVVVHALNARSRDQRAQSVEVLRLLEAPGWPPIEPPPNDVPPNESSEQPP